MKSAKPDRPAGRTRQVENKAFSAAIFQSRSETNPGFGACAPSVSPPEGPLGGASGGVPPRPRSGVKTPQDARGAGKSYPTIGSRRDRPHSKRPPENRRPDRANHVVGGGGYAAVTRLPPSPAFHRPTIRALMTIQLPAAPLKRMLNGVQKNKAPVQPSDRDGGMFTPDFGT